MRRFLFFISIKVIIAGLENSHHGSAAEGDEKHEQPVGDQAESPHDVAEGHGETVLGGLAVEGVEPAINEDEVLLVTRGLEGDQVIRGGGGQVEPLLVNLDGCRLGKQVKDVEAGGASGPRVAQDGLVVAVQIGHVRAVLEKRELGRGLVEGLLDGSASAYACVLATLSIAACRNAHCASQRVKHTVARLVSARNQQPPLLGGGGISGDGLVEGLLPVLEGQDVESHGASLGLGRSDRIMVAWVGNVAANLAEEVLELGLVLVDGRVLGSGEGGQSREDSGRGEAHDELDDYGPD